MKLVVVIFIIALFTVILISNFPAMLRQFALSRVTYQFAQDLRKTQDLGLSGVQLNDKYGTAIAVKGYGIYINFSNSTKQYLIYADVADATGVSDNKYDGDFNTIFCNNIDQTSSTLKTDCIVSITDVTKEDPSLSIEKVTDGGSNSYNSLSVNFSPPTPITTITTNAFTQPSTVNIFLKNTDGTDRGVSVNSSGLINIQ